jgi:hypothetical protein
MDDKIKQLEIPNNGEKHFYFDNFRSLSRGRVLFDIHFTKKDPEKRFEPQEFVLESTSELPKLINKIENLGFNYIGELEELRKEEEQKDIDKKEVDEEWYGKPSRRNKKRKWANEAGEELFEHETDSDNVYLRSSISLDCNCLREKFLLGSNEELQAIAKHYKKNNAAVGYMVHEVQIKNRDDLKVESLVTFQRNEQVFIAAHKIHRTIEQVDEALEDHDLIKTGEKRFYTEKNTGRRKNPSKVILYEGPER